jgi:hypothetical protein
VSQIKIQAPLPVPHGCSNAAYYADREQTLLKVYKQDQYFKCQCTVLELPSENELGCTPQKCTEKCFCCVLLLSKERHAK